VRPMHRIANEGSQVWNTDWTRQLLDDEQPSVGARQGEACIACGVE
jgi:hypothetical protein